MKRDASSCTGRVDAVQPIGSFSASAASFASKSVSTDGGGGDKYEVQTLHPAGGFTPLCSYRFYSYM